MSARIGPEPANSYTVRGDIESGVAPSGNAADGRVSNVAQSRLGAAITYCTACNCSNYRIGVMVAAWTAAWIVGGTLAYIYQDK